MHEAVRANFCLRGLSWLLLNYGLFIPLAERVKKKVEGHLTFV